MQNSGFKTLGNIQHDHNKEQYIVVGVARGGTSAVTASLNALGVTLSGNYNDTILEDVEMAKAFRSKNWKDFKRLITEYEEKYQKFAWKLPDSHSQLERINKYFSNPYFIFVYRDIFSIANRKNITLNIDITEAMNSNLVAYQKIVKFIKKRNPQSLHVSYEKMLQNNMGYAEELAKFCNITASEELLNKVCDVIEPAPDTYVHWCDTVNQNTTLKAFGYEGCIDQLTEKEIAGWITNIDNDVPVKIDLLINGKFVLELTCQIFREDLILAGKSSSGNAGFDIPLENIDLKKNDEVRINPRGHNTGLIAYVS